jgi:hypothetical protein
MVNEDGNEMTGLRSPDLEAPLGTYTGWCLRKEGFGEGELLSLNGSFIPFARTKAERIANGDPRLSVEERYGSHDAYVAAVSDSVHQLLVEGMLLREDADRFLEAARSKNPLDPSITLGPLLP